MKKTKLWTGVLPLLCLTFCSCSSVSTADGNKTADYKYWDLGAGSYGSNYGNYHDTTFLDLARYDWLYICFGNEPATKQNTERLNEYLKINPKQKYVIRLWPVYKYKAPGQKVSHLTSFMDYLYDPNVKKRILQTVDQQLDSVMNHISNKDAVYGITLLEEMPFHFSDRGYFNVNPDKLPRDMEYYKKYYEQETGKKLLKWDADARTWWAKKYVHVMNEIHGHIKKRVPGKRIFLYFMSHVRTLDFLEKGEEKTAWGVLPVYMKEFIGPDKADGFFAFPANQQYLQKWTALAKKLNAPYFIQVSVPGGMRLPSWDEYMQIAKHKVKENLGYFFYAVCHDWPGEWNDCPYGKEDPWRASIQIRQHLAHENVGMDIVRKNLKPEILLEYDLDKVRMNDWATIHCIVRNPADDTWFVNPGEGTMKNIRLNLTVPPDFELPSLNNPSNVFIKQLGGGKNVRITWWARRIAPASKVKKTPMKLTVTADGFEPETLLYPETQKLIRQNNKYSLRSSGDFVEYINFAIPWQNSDAVVTITSRGVCSMPSIQTSTGGRLTWVGMLSRRDKLVFGPGKKAVLFRHGVKGPGKDVSKDVYGVPLTVTKGVNKITYFDQDAKSGRPKLDITIEAIVKKK
ncbi:MAG: hypothetical protein IKB16_03970 [Lentisphaeria bacterium]|nr:hypothetical protein [Lentisphaeria bacterium]